MFRVISFFFFRFCKSHFEGTVGVKNDIEMTAKVTKVTLLCFKVTPKVAKVTLPTFEVIPKVIPKA